MDLWKSAFVFLTRGRALGTDLRNVSLIPLPSWVGLISVFPPLFCSTYIVFQPYVILFVVGLARFPVCLVRVKSHAQGKERFNLRETTWDVYNWDAENTPSPIIHFFSCHRFLLFSSCSFLTSLQSNKNLIRNKFDQCDELINKIDFINRIFILSARQNTDFKLDYTLLILNKDFKLQVTGLHVPFCLLYFCCYYHLFKNKFLVFPERIFLSLQPLFINTKPNPSLCVWKSGIKSTRVI